MTAVLVGAATAAAALAAVRWLRVAQREHYLPGSVTRFALRWWGDFDTNRLLALAAGVGALLCFVRPLPGLVACVAVGVGPFGLTVRGRTTPLAWTRRLRTLAVATGLLYAAVIAAGLGLGAGGPTAIVAALLVPVLVDLAALAMRPVENRLAERYVIQAGQRLRSVAPVVVGVTGSYGKTSTKGYIAHLVSSAKATVASPASFNNRAGLARAVNEHLAPGTQVFVAEMGTYGKGEIAAMCTWVRPTIGVITAIGPVHLERFGSEDRIVEAKSELVEATDVAVLNVDDPRLRHLAFRLKGAGKRVLQCSATDADADVAVLRDGDHLVVHALGVELTRIAAGAAQPTNVACAVAVARELAVPAGVIGDRLASLPTAANRLESSIGSKGFVILDDTYNSNPAGATAALQLLGRSGTGTRRVVVTPGMVELGSRQYDANVAFAAAASKAVTHLVVVGHTNRKALMEGAQRGRAEVVVVEHREDAVEWVRQHLGNGDAVLYENDLPDHYP